LYKFQFITYWYIVQFVSQSMQQHCKKHMVFEQVTQWSA